MKNQVEGSREPNKSQGATWKFGGAWTIFLLAAAVVASDGCHKSPAQKANTNFFTSGSREADQRASQRMAQSEQLAGTGEGSGEKGVKKAKVKNTDGSESTPSPTGTTNVPAQATNKLSLFQRLGGEAGVSNIVSDFTQRAMDDPRVNWARQGVTRGGLSIHRNQSEAWNPTPQNVDLLKKHMVEFLGLATGGPAKYTGKQIEAAHADMKISNPEFDAAIGDLKASLDKLKIPNTEQKELLSIVESTRPEIVTKR
jgi:hemoglobin